MRYFCLQIPGTVPLWQVCMTLYLNKGCDMGSIAEAAVGGGSKWTYLAIYLEAGG